MSDGDCEDQACGPTEVCIKFACQTWDGDVRIQPLLELRGKYWCCPKCGDSYGEHAKGVRNMNGVAPEQMTAPNGPSPIPKDCEDVAKLFDQLAAEARKGQVMAACIVCVHGPGRFSPSFTGNLLMEQYIGCDMVKTHITAMMAGQHPMQQAQKARQPQILRAPPGMQVK